MQRPVLSVIVAVLMACSAVLAQQPPSSQAQSQTQSQPQRTLGPPTSAAGRPISPEALSGTWDYNDALSVDAATGRPERAPRGGTQRVLPPPSGGSATASGGVTRPAAGGSGANTGGGDRVEGGPDSFEGARRAMAAVIAAERRTYVRDLLEVAEKITIRATPDEVTFVDDLDRQQTYTTDGRMQKYQLSAARYEASGSWAETHFRKDIKGSNSFKMTETYFVSEDGNRLFLLIRIGDPRKPETLAGVNRVYDRVPSLR